MKKRIVSILLAAIMVVSLLSVTAFADNNGLNDVALSADVKNGKVEVSPESAAAGDTVTITVTPDKGFTLETLTVTDEDGEELAVNALEDGRFGFEMPDGKVSVDATFMEDNAMLNFFVDVKAADYYYDAVLWAAENDITKGTDAVHFSPDASVTRAQVVTFLYRIAQQQGKGFTGDWMFPLSFTDANTIPDYAREAVTWCSMNSIVEGYANGAFGPNDNVTREQLAAILYRFAKYMGEQGFVGGWVFPLNFSDASAVSSWANEAMHWCVMKQIITGSNGALTPQGYASRAQVVTMLYRFCGVVFEQ